MTLKKLLLSLDGRIGRKHYWYFYGALMILFTLAFISKSGIVILLLTLGAFWPSLAILAKRWHDRDKSAWWILISFIPIIGAIWALVENGFLRGTAGENRFGPDPLQ